MKAAQWLRRAMALLAVLIAASCASPTPALYTIAPLPGQQQFGTPKVVEVKSVGIARYLQRSPIVRSSDGYRVDLRPNDWWGEPLEAMLGRVLIEDLSQRLPNVTIYSSTGAVTASPDAGVELEVQRMDLDGAGNLIFVAQSSVSLKNRQSPDTRSFRISVPVPSSDTQSQVAAISSALAQTADGIAAMLTHKAASK